MTLVAAFRINGIPVLVGDLLLTGQGPQESIEIPTVGDVSLIPLFPDSDEAIKGLVQKVNILSENLVIGWTGSYPEAKSIISDLKQVSATGSLTKELLQDFFESRKSWVGSEKLAFVGYIKDFNGIHSFEYSYNGCAIHKPKSNNYEELKIIGTGYYDAELFLAKNTRKSRPDTKLSNFDNAVISTICFCGFFFSDEMRLSKSSLAEENERTLFDRYGGGYEVAIYTENGFQKLNHVSYFSWLVQNIDTEPIINLINRGFKVSYANNILLIHRFEESKNNKNHIFPPELVEHTLFPITLEQPYYILPIYNKMDQQEIEELLEGTEISLNSEFNCSYLFHDIPPTEESDWPVPVACKPYRSPEVESGHIQFLKIDDDWFIAVNNSYLEYLRTTFSGRANS